MTTKYEIPLSAQNQIFSISLAGIKYNMTIRWNAQITAWVLDIADSNSNPIVSSIPLVTGTDLLAAYAYLKFGGTLTVASDNNADAIPTLSNLGAQSHLYFTTTP